MSEEVHGSLVPRYTKPELSERLLEAGFPVMADAFYSKPGKGYKDDYLPCWRQDTLENWLMTDGPFSRRTATIQIAFRAMRHQLVTPDPVSNPPVHPGDEWVGRYIVTAFNGASEPLGQGIEETIIAALGEVVVQVLKGNQPGDELVAESDPEAAADFVQVGDSVRSERRTSHE